MPILLHPFDCLRNYKRLSVNGRDGIIYQITDQIVFKAPFAWTNPTDGLHNQHLESVDNIEREKAIYHLLEAHGHPNILFKIMSVPEGIFLQYANGGNLDNRLALATKQPIHGEEKLAWILAIAKAELLLARLGYVHGDMKPANILLHNGEIKVCDFCATVPIGEQLIAPRLSRFSRPANDVDVNMTADEASEIFALGTYIYIIVMEYEPYPTLTEGEVSSLFQGLIFPSTENERFKEFGRIGAVVRSSWLGHYHSIAELYEEVESAYNECGILPREWQKNLKIQEHASKSLTTDCQRFLDQAKTCVK